MRDNLIIVAALGIGVVLVYLFRKQLGLTAVADAASNAATGTLTERQINDIAAEASASVLRAGGTQAQAKSAAAEVVRDIRLNQPFITTSLFGITITAVSAQTEVLGTGHTVYELRSIGYSDFDIKAMFDYYQELQAQEAASMMPVTP